MVFIDDMRIYSLSEETHQEYLRDILTKSGNRKMFAMSSKHEFLVERGSLFVNLAQGLSGRK